jgi:carboxyl-terminal processing protease
MLRRHRAHSLSNAGLLVAAMVAAMVAAIAAAMNALPRRFASLTLAAAALLAGATVGGCTTTTKSNAAARAPAVRPAETFDAAWTMVRDEHYDQTLNGVDWNAVRDELRPRAANARTTAELREILNEMLARLGQSHFTIIPGADVKTEVMTAVTLEAMSDEVATPTFETTPPVETTQGASPDVGASAQTPAESGVGATNAGESGADAPSDVPGIDGPKVDGPSVDGPGIAGIDIAIVEGEPTVLRVTPGLPGARAGILVGWRLISVDGFSVADALRPIRNELASEKNIDSPRARQLRAALAFGGGEMLTGEAGSRRIGIFADASGAEQRVEIVLETAPLGSTKFGNLPAFPIEVESRVVEIPVDGAKPIRIGVISFNIWMTAASEAIDRAVDALRSCDGIVLDLRGNPGGMGAMSMGIAGHFLREPASLGSMIGRSNTLEFYASPRKVSADGKRVRPYATKPLAVLIDGRSASTSEVFAGGLQDLGRARVFGETSAGMALPAQATTLPNGDVLLHAVADFVTSKGTRLEGRGVLPDETAAPTRDALLHGNDAALTAASQWIKTSTVATRAAKAMPVGTSSSMPTAMPTAMPPAIGTEPK